MTLQCISEHPEEPCHGDDHRGTDLPNGTGRYTGETFEDKTPNVDGNAYTRCKFIRCRLIFSGELEVS
jgi:hypothetical protein